MNLPHCYTCTCHYDDRASEKSRRHAMNYGFDASSLVGTEVMVNASRTSSGKLKLNYQTLPKGENMNINEIKKSRFLNSGGKLPEPVKTINPEEKKSHFANIFSNTSEYIWVASGDRKFHISEGHGRIVAGYPALADKHLINIMRYLITNWKEMRSAVDSDLMAITKKYPTLKIIGTNENDSTAPKFLEKFVKPWPSLVNEVVNRFGPDALVALLDGL